MDQDQQQFCVNVKMTMDMYQELSRQMTSLRVRQVSEHLRAHEMSLNHFSILHILQIEEEISSNQLASHLRLKAASITYLVDSLEKRGLVTRIDNPDDRRSHYIRLTEAGRQMSVIPDLCTEVAQKLETLDRSDLETLYLAMRLASSLLFR